MSTGRAAVVGVVLLVLAAAPASAQEPTVPAGASAASSEQQDLFDFLKRLRRKPPATPGAEPQAEWDYRKPMIAVMPAISSKPSTGVSLGASGSVAVYFGDPKTTPISSAVMGLSVSSKKQTVLAAKFSASSANNRMRLEGDNRLQWTSQDSYGLGTGTTVADEVTARFTYVRVYETALFQLGKGIFAGVGFHYANHSALRPGVDGDPLWDPSAFAAYSRQYGFDLESQSSAGPGFNLLVDTRDNPINASKGWLASISYRPYFKDLLGGDSAWQQVVLDLRTFVKVKKNERQKVALWVYGDLVADGVAPYFDLPALGTDTYGRTGRGYTEGRFRGERLLYGEVEYRATLTRNGLLGMVAFANTTTVANRQTGESLFDGFAPAGGVGLRLSFNKRSKTNLCADFAWGKGGSKGLYLALQEAF